MTINYRPEDKLRDVADIYLGSNNVLAFVNEDGILIMNTYLTPSTPIGTVVNYEHEGFIIHTLYKVGTTVARASLIKVTNDINIKLREGCFYVDEDGALEYRTFIPDTSALDARLIARSIKTSIFTFLDNLDDIMEVLDSVSNLSDSDFTILDTQNADEVKG